MDEFGVEKIDASNGEFNPNIHEAVAMENSDSIPEGSIIKQWRCGYKMAEKLLRPATVVVSSGPASLKDEDNGQGN